MKNIGKRKKLKVMAYAPSTVKKFITGNGQATKAEVARVLVIKFPDLRVFLTQDRAYKERFHQNMFERRGGGDDGWSDGEIKDNHRQFLDELGT